MELVLPDVCKVIDCLLPVVTSMDARSQTIAAWIKEHRATILQNQRKISDRSDENDLYRLRIFLRELLMRGINAEAGTRIGEALDHFVREKADLTFDNFRQVLERARYRWGSNGGIPVMTEVADYFCKTLNWDWDGYFKQAEAGKLTDFKDDRLLQIKNVKFKVRDLALSNFSTSYAAFDLHVTRVVSRLGLVAYGWELTRDRAIDFGTNPSIDSNYLFFHRLFLRFGNLTNGRFTSVDLDRIFWHLGRSYCGARTECSSCPVKELCLTGRCRTA